MDLINAMRERVLVAEGAMGTRLFSKGIAPEECLEALNLLNPSLVREVHEEYRAAGAEIYKTNTFGASTVRLASHNAEAKCREINAAGVRVARAVAGSEGLVAGSVGPLGEHVAFGVRKIFEIQIAALAEAGPDFILLETFRDLDEIHEAILAARAVCDLPVVAQVSPDQRGTLEGGIGPEDFTPLLDAWGADAIGCNCGAGPALMIEMLRRMALHTDKPLTAQPSAGLPFYQDGQLVFPCLPEEMAETARQFLVQGVRIVGGCCGTIPEHIAAIRAVVNSSSSNTTLRSGRTEGVKAGK
jgi:methionine synthase I (cobalamin-dependent)